MLMMVVAAVDGERSRASDPLLLGGGPPKTLPGKNFLLKRNKRKCCSSPGAGPVRRDRDCGTFVLVYCSG